MEEFKLHGNIICIDLKSFYASVECALRGLNPFTTPLVVADRSRSNGSVVLAVTPAFAANLLQLVILIMGHYINFPDAAKMRLCLIS